MNTRVVHFHTTHMSLPISSAITFLAVVLPIAAFLNAYVYPNLLRVSHTFTAGTSLERLAPVLFQGLQAVVTAIMATLLLEGIVPSPALDFLIEYEWGKLYAARDEARMQVIQDTYNCCGLNDVDDRAVPIVSIPGGSCAELFGRTMSCRGPWQAAMQVTSAVDFGVVVVVGLMQVSVGVGFPKAADSVDYWSAYYERADGLVDGAANRGLEAQRRGQQRWRCF